MRPRPSGARVLWCEVTDEVSPFGRLEGETVLVGQLGKGRLHFQATTVDDQHPRQGSIDGEMW